MSYLKKRKQAFGYAFRGVAMLFRNEAHARLHLIAAILVTVFGFIFRIDRWEWAAVILCIGGVFMAEAFNTAIEKLADKVSKERHPLLGAAKDLAAAAVLLFSLATLAIAALIFLPRLLPL